MAMICLAGVIATQRLTAFRKPFSHWGGGSLDPDFGSFPLFLLHHDQLQGCIGVSALRLVQGDT